MKIEYGNRIAHLDAQLKLSEQNHELTVQRRRAVEVEAAREIKTGQRRIIEYLLSPLLRYRQESLRER